jgi:hypothetical protein
MQTSSGDLHRVRCDRRNTGRLELSPAGSWTVRDCEPAFGSCSRTPRCNGAITAKRTEQAKPQKSLQSMQSLRRWARTSPGSQERPVASRGGSLLHRISRMHVLGPPVSPPPLHHGWALGDPPVTSPARFRLPMRSRGHDPTSGQMHFWDTARQGKLPPTRIHSAPSMELGPACVWCNQGTWAKSLVNGLMVPASSIHFPFADEMEGIEGNGWDTLTVTPRPRPRSTTLPPPYLHPPP